MMKVTISALSRIFDIGHTFGDELIVSIFDLIETDGCSGRCRSNYWRLHNAVFNLFRGIIF